jgi:phage-related protein
MRSFYSGANKHLVALLGFIKKTRATPDDDLKLARKRQKELEQ